MATSKEDIEAELAAWNVAPMTEQEGYAAFIPGQPVSSFDPAGDNPFVLNDLSAASYDEASFNQHQRKPTLVLAISIAKFYQRNFMSVVPRYLQLFT